MVLLGDICDQGCVGTPAPPSSPCASPDPDSVLQAADEREDPLVDNEDNNSQKHEGECLSSVSLVASSSSNPEEAEMYQFEHALSRTIDMISRPRWMVPVQSKGELPALLRRAILLSEKGIDVTDPLFTKFINAVVPVCFHKILTDDAVKEWSMQIHEYIYDCCESVIELSCHKMTQDCLPLLEVLAYVFDPRSRYHIINANQRSLAEKRRDEVAKQCGSQSSSSPGDEVELSQRIYSRFGQGVLQNQRAWLVDLLNKFGRCGGFDKMVTRFQSEEPLSISILNAYLKPFAACVDFLDESVLQDFFTQIAKIAFTVIESVGDEELKKDCSRVDSRENSISAVLRCLQMLTSRTEGQKVFSDLVAVHKLKMIFRILQIAPFGGKMNALLDLARIFSTADPICSNTKADCINKDVLVEWLKQCGLVSILLRENLHHVQYVERLESIFRFMIKEKALCETDLDALWAAQQGRHDMVVKNVHNLLSKLAWEFSGDQLDHLFKRFQESWRDAGAKEREQLLELMRRLAEDDKSGNMAQKVQDIMWSIAHNFDLNVETVELALSAQVKILEASFASDRDKENHRLHWLKKCIDEMLSPSQSWVIPALLQFRSICGLYKEPSGNGLSIHNSRTVCRYDVIRNLQESFQLVVNITKGLLNYVVKFAEHVNLHNLKLIDPKTYSLDGRYTHYTNIHERLEFVKYLLKDGQLWLCDQQATDIWECLIVNALCTEDRDEGFRWFASLMSDEPDLDPEVERKFYENCVLRIEPSILTRSGLECFVNFFKHINCKLNKLTVSRSGVILLRDVHLIGDDFLWHCITHAVDEVAQLTIETMKDMYSNPHSRLLPRILELHSEFISICVNRLCTTFDSLQNVSEHPEDENTDRFISQLSIHAYRTFRLLLEYVIAYDSNFPHVRMFPPLAVAYFGDIELLVRISSIGRQVEDVEVIVHENMTLLQCRRYILRQVAQQSGLAQGANAANTTVELFINNELIDPANDKKLLRDLGWKGDRTVLLTARFQQSVGQNSSPHSSSSESSPSATPMPNIDNASGDNTSPGEELLPGVLLAHKQNNVVELLLKYVNLSMRLGLTNLQQLAFDILRAIPGSSSVIGRVKSVCLEDRNIPASPGLPCSTVQLVPSSNGWEALLFSCSPADVLYTMELIYTLLLPGNVDAFSQCINLRRSVLVRGVVQLWLDTLIRNNFLASCNSMTKFEALPFILRLLKFGLFCTGYGRSVLSERRDFLRKALIASIPFDRAVKHAGTESVRFGQQICNVNISEQHVVALIKLLWAAAADSPLLYSLSFAEIHFRHQQLWSKDLHKGSCAVSSTPVVVNGLEVAALMLIVSPSLLSSLLCEAFWCDFLYDLLFSSLDEVRVAMEEFIIHTSINMPDLNESKIPRIQQLLNLLIGALDTLASSRPCAQYFNVLTRILVHCRVNSIDVLNFDDLLQRQFRWLKKAKEHIALHVEPFPNDELLTGRLHTAKELVYFLSPQRKIELASDLTGSHLIKELIDDYVLPSSRMYVDLKRVNISHNFPRSQTIDVKAAVSADFADAQLSQDGDPFSRVPRSQTTIIAGGSCIPVCATPNSTAAAYDLIVSLASNCLPNMKCVAESLTAMYYDDESRGLQEWDYIPPVGLRPQSGFVGLKNSVIQQLFMISSIREGILTVEAGQLLSDDDSEDTEEAKPVTEFIGPLLPAANEAKEISDTSSTVKISFDQRDYNMNILRCMQLIFGHLVGSQLQFYVPRKFWRHFRFSEEPINLREQHDAVEFMDKTVDSIDEACKSLSVPPICQKVLSGAFSDQKICRGCPHKYSKSDSFTYINIDIRNASNLLDALADYTRGELLEGADAYFCEKCNAKVDAMKRILIKTLPPVLVIQLKRFDYDWERGVAVKFNDYFEFPREVDMEPYTVQGRANRGESVVDEEVSALSEGSKYSLRGVVVHSGQATGGHYYSYILHKSANEVKTWYKFDDGDVSEARLEDDEELKTQCFGGDCGSVPNRRQKRWWNAYILLYERIEAAENSLCAQFGSFVLNPRFRSMPSVVERVVRFQNMQVVHQRNQFSPEYFNFIRRLVSANTRQVQQYAESKTRVPEDLEECVCISLTLSMKFLFMTGFHARKIVRSPFQDWIEVVAGLLKYSKLARQLLARQLVVLHPERLPKYLLECPSPDVRFTFSRILAVLAQHSKKDELLADVQMKPVDALHTLGTGCLSSMSDQLLFVILALLRREVSDFGRHLQQYFGLFHWYVQQGYEERAQLLNLNVVILFIRAALDDGPGPAIRYQYPDFGKLFAVVSVLVRSCDLSCRCDKAQNKPNPYQECFEGHKLFELPADTATYLLDRPNYTKKLIEDAGSGEENFKLLKFCCWENENFSRLLLWEVLSQLTYAYTYEVRPVFDMLFSILNLEDSLQETRILWALRGIDEGIDNRMPGIFDTIMRNRTHCHKRAYQLIKRLTYIFTSIADASRILAGNGELKRKWIAVVKWLNEEYERRPFPPSHYGYNNQWSPTVQSNETSSGYFLERTQSLRETLGAAYSLVQEYCASESETAEDDISDAESGLVDENQNTSDVVGPSSSNTINSTLLHPLPDADTAETNVEKPPPYSDVVSGSSGSHFSTVAQNISAVPVDRDSAQMCTSTMTDETSDCPADTPVLTNYAIRTSQSADSGLINAASRNQNLASFASLQQSHDVAGLRDAQCSLPRLPTVDLALFASEKPLKCAGNTETLAEISCSKPNQVSSENYD